MSLNVKMHPRNPFKNNPPDFTKLSDKYPQFAIYCTFNKQKKCSIDFKNADALRSLCCILMKELFNFEINIPIDHLIPRIPQRLNYVLWIEDLLNRPEKATGIDIGCGSSCIFSLIICGLNKEWKMLTTDISDENLKFAIENVNKNNLNNRIKLIKVNEGTILKDIFFDETGQYDFLMCNPPFYSNQAELEGDLENIRKPEKRHLPNSINTARLHESVYDDGGEVGFVKKMIDESIEIGNRIKIYTTMLGKKKSLIELKNYFLQNDIKNVSDTAFYQGHTMRWGVCWSFDNTIRLNSEEVKKKVDKNKLKPINFEIPKNSFQPEQQTCKFIYEYLKNVFIDELQFNLKEENNFKAVLIAFENTWSNQRQKRRNQKYQKVSNDQGLHTDKTANSINKDILIEFNVEILERTSKFYLELTSIEIARSTIRETLNQILQFIRNKLT